MRSIFLIFFKLSTRMHIRGVWLGAAQRISAGIAMAEYTHYTTQIIPHDAIYFALA